MYNFRTMYKLFRRTTLISRKKHLWSSEKICRSPYRDVNIPNMTIPEYVWKDLDKWSDKTAVVCAVTDRKYTYAEVYKQSQVFGANLKKKFNLSDGECVAVMLPNIPEYPAITLGILAAGGVVTTVNPIYIPYEIQRQILMSESKLIITLPSTFSTVKQALTLAKKTLPIISVDIDENQKEDAVLFSELINNDIDLSILNKVKTKGEDVALLPYSSGTTGLPKGVQLTHVNALSNCEQQNTELRQYEHTTGNHQDTVLANLPFFHLYGLSMVMLHKMSVGLKLVSIPKFTPQYFVSALEKHNCNLMYLAPPTVHFMAYCPDVKSRYLDNLRMVTVGEASLAASDSEMFLSKVPHKDLNFGQGYGLTEGGPVVTLFPPGCKDHTTAGVAVPNVKLRVVDDNMQNLGPSEAGELLIQAPGVMKGYKDNEDANRQTLINGWLRTGDCVSIDENGFIKIIERLKDLIKVKGFQVSPAEIESIIKEHPDVFDAAVIGVPDEYTGERPKAFVVLNKGGKIDASIVKEYVSKKVAPFKQVKEVEFVDSIPKSATGKILRRCLR